MQQSQQKRKRWKYNATEQVFECVICGYKHSEPGGVHMHSLRAHEGIGGVKNQDKPKKQQQGCQHEWALLQEQIAPHNAAIKVGYTVYCKLCEEVQ